MRNSGDFLTNIPFPFIGRRRELERLLEFWEGTPDAQELRAALVVGEAGIGKSRLLEEMIPRVERQGGRVVHAKLYPESTSSVVPLIAAPLRSADPAGHYAGNLPDESLSSVASALRRLSRLRPTLLVVEDIHLLSGASLSEFSLLLSALSEEIIGVLCLARPVELRVKGVLEQYLVEEMELKGLSEEEVARLWEEALGSASHPEIARSLRQASQGNPLALRSALRGAFKAGLLQGEGTERRLRAEISPDHFATMIAGSVALLSEGMAAGLSQEEKGCAGRLALLGEVFSREGGRVMIDEADGMIAALIAKGIIATSTIPTIPLPAIGQERRRIFPASSHRLLSFTHSLLHRSLLAQPDVDIPRLVSVIARGLPLYSVLPFQIITERLRENRLPRDITRAAIEQTLLVAFHRDSSPDWEMGKQILGAAEALLDAPGVAWDRDEGQELKAFLLYHKVLIHRREHAAEEFRAMVDALMEMTEEPAPPSLLELRLRGFRYQHWMEANRGDYTTCVKTWEAVEGLVARYPELRTGRAYSDYLRAAISAATRYGDDRIARLVERRLQEILSLQTMSEKGRIDTWGLVAPYLLELFDTPDELASRLTLLDDLERHDDGSDPRLRMCAIFLLHSIGEADRALAAIEESLPFFTERGEFGFRTECLLSRLDCRGWIGVDRSEIEAEGERLLAESSPETVPWLHAEVGRRMLGIALLRDDQDWIRNMLAVFPDLGQVLSDDERILIASIDGSSNTRPLPNPILRMTDVMALRAAIDLLEKKNGGASSTPSATDQTTIHDLLVRILEWFSTRELPALMTPIIARYGDRFTSKEVGAWRKKIDAIRIERGSGDAVHDGRLSVTMLGTISMATPGQEPQRLRGGRVRSFLGLLVADRMLRTPLSYREFSRLAADGDNDATRARDMVNLAVHRLRETLGRDAILTGEETPRLNLERVRVDILEAYDLMKRGIEAIRGRSFMRAPPALTKALGIVGSEVPFPALYSDFFEAARTDFECALRDAVIALARELAREGDPAAAAELLRLGAEAMKEDEEISELLRETLVGLGRRAEAERERMKSQEI